MTVAEALELEGKIREKLERTFKKLGYTFEKVENQSEFFKLTYHVFFGYSIRLEIKWEPDYPEKLHFRVMYTDSPAIKKFKMIEIEHISYLEKTLKEFEEIEKEDGERHPEYFV